jgi:cell division protein FtsL
LEKIKISDLAGELGIDKKELLAKAQEFGSTAKATTKVLTEDEIIQLRNFYQGSEEKESSAEDLLEEMEIPSKENIEKEEKKKRGLFSFLKGYQKKEKPPKPPKLKTVNIKKRSRVLIGFLLFLIVFSLYTSFASVANSSKIQNLESRLSESQTKQTNVEKELKALEKGLGVKVVSKIEK